LLTPKDIENPKRTSGYKHVKRSDARTANGHGGGKPYQARVEAKRADGRPGSLPVWMGPRRATALEAAQDYCDYVNGNSTPSGPRLASAGNSAPRDKIAVTDEYEAALGVIRDVRAQKKHHRGFVYCIGEVGEWYAVKVGFSLKPIARVSELQTGNPRPLVLLGTIKGTVSTERDLHAKYIDYNIVGEWFTPADDLLAEFGITKEASSA
jgi:hypothetical protein